MKKNKKTAPQLQTKPRQSTFSKYRGIGNPGIGLGRKNIARWLREMRGGYERPCPIDDANDRRSLT